MKPELRYVHGHKLEGEQQREALREAIRDRNAARLIVAIKRERFRRFMESHRLTVPARIVANVALCITRLSISSWLGILLIVAGVVALAAILSGCDDTAAQKAAFEAKYYQCMENVAVKDSYAIRECRKTAYLFAR
jgi:hypothetical protein